MGIIAWIVLGVVAGLLAKLLMPGRDPGGIITQPALLERHTERIDPTQDVVSVFGPVCACGTTIASGERTLEARGPLGHLAGSPHRAAARSPDEERSDEQCREPAVHSR